MALTISLTAQEVATVQQRQLDANKLPTYYNSATRANQQISRDFEAFLILSPDDLKTSAIDWIKKAVTLQQANKDRDQLSALAFAQESLNATNKMNALDEHLADFNDFREKFQTQTDFAGIQEVQTFLLDLQRVIEELASARDRAQFDGVASQVVQRADDRLLVDKDDIEELQSWTGVLSTYLR